MSKVIFITGAGRGLGPAIARQALDAGHRVIATGRRPGKISELLGESGNLLVAALDITNPDDAETVTAAAVAKFGRIDVLVNNASTFQAGFFEEISPEAMRRQLETNLFGPMNVTRAVLPQMRRQRSGHVLTISSTAGMIGQEFCAAYASSKFGVEGWMESLRFDLEPFGITTTIVEPGFFRTELLEEASTTWADTSIADYAARTSETKAGWQSMNGRQAGDPAKLAKALIQVIGLDEPPLRFVAGADAIPAIIAKGREISQQAEDSRALGFDLNFNN
ncbi:oxidoreductase [Arthrobacter sp. ERGS1:01]|uniref:SDR family NAD(P)-dependent oxidoreductase n=1 Tax=Arthrobacter sp. ERGS1:01 TaxID=1704044 RepID=UPI0006B53A37|nr:SDR family NAD(P)-dependent oxidoreductase [Arthrobacter sp. ERGS1:01]ALE05592.1 oxidoreductase [Arthrobacter sp. ERGS1:01]